MKTADRRPFDPSLGLSHPRLWPLWTWSLLVPFLVMALVLPGPMPRRGAQGTLTLMLCTGMGQLEVQVDPMTGHPVQKDQTKAAAPCQWHMARDVALPLPPFDAPAVASAFVPAAATPVGTPLFRTTRFTRPLGRATQRHATPSHATPRQP